MKQTTDIKENLATGVVAVNTEQEQKYQDFMTLQHKKVFGKCDRECDWVKHYGWVPEAGCPVHD